MDLVAYSQIDDYKSLLDALNVKIPRLRGLRDMAEEKPVAMKGFYDIEEAKKVVLKEVIAQRSQNVYVYDGTTIRKEQRYIIGGNIQYKRIHGKLKKRFNKEYGRRNYYVCKELEMFNKFAGKEVLYVHARIGRLWNKYGNDIKKHPNFLGWQLDCYDETYCDIYFKKAGATWNSQKH